MEWSLIGLLTALMSGLFYWIIGLSVGWIFGLSSGLCFGLSVWLLLGLFQGVSSETIGDQHRVIPNQGIRRSVRNSLVLGLISAVIVGLLYGLSIGLSNALLAGLFFGMSTGLGFGLSFGLGSVLDSWQDFFMEDLPLFGTTSYVSCSGVAGQCPGTIHASSTMQQSISCCAKLGAATASCISSCSTTLPILRSEQALMRQ